MVRGTFPPWMAFGTLANLWKVLLWWRGKLKYRSFTSRHVNRKKVVELPKGGSEWGCLSAELRRQLVATFFVPNSCMSIRFLIEDDFSAYVKFVSMIFLASMSRILFNNKVVFLGCKPLVYDFRSPIGFLHYEQVEQQISGEKTLVESKLSNLSAYIVNLEETDSPAWTESITAGYPNFT